jgi:hypothetical protein
MRYRTHAERQDYADDLDLRYMTPEQADAEMEARDRKRSALTDPQSKMLYAIARGLKEIRSSGLSTARALCKRGLIDLSWIQGCNYAVRIRPAGRSALAGVSK